MKALVKNKREPGLWLDEVPEPTIGINDLLIRVLRTEPEVTAHLTLDLAER